MKQDKNILDQWNKELPFQVPENYFQDLPENIMKKIEQEEKKTNTIRLQKRPFLYMVASIAIVFFIGGYLFLKDTGNTVNDKEMLAQNEEYDIWLSLLDEDTLMEYIVENEIN